MTNALTDIRHALRRWRARPGFVLTAVFTLALGIGTTTAIFSVVDGVLLRPLPYASPDRLITMWVMFPQWRERPALSAMWDRVPISWLDLRELESRSRTLQSVGAWSDSRPAIVHGQTDVVRAREISAALLSTLGVAPFAGRSFTRGEEDAPSDAAMITYEAWQRRFGGDAAILGRRFVVDDMPRTIVGVLPKGFIVAGDSPELLLPLGSFNPRDRTITNRNDANRPYQAVARLKSGISIDAAAADIEPILRADKETRVQTSRVESLDALFFGVTRRPLLLLLGASCLLLIIACANVTGLLIGDAHARRRELAVRHALGAGRWRVVRQLLAESVMLAIGGGSLGIVAAWWLTPALVAIAPAGLPRIDAVGVDGRVLSFAVVISVATTTIAGTAPMLRRVLLDVIEPIAAGRGMTGHGRVQDALVVVQMALAIVLVAGAMLLGETVVRLGAQPLGFEVSHLVAMRLPVQPAVPADVRASRRAALLDRLRSTPGVESAALVSAAPFAGNFSATSVEIDARPGVSATSRRYVIGDGYFHAMRMPLLHGRDFAPTDSGAEPVTIVSKEFERRYYAGNALGRRIRVNQAWLTVVGVVPDSKLRDPSEATDPAFYVPIAQQAGANEIVVRTAADAVSMVAVLRDAAMASKAVPALSAIEAVGTLMRKTIAEERYRAVLSSSFGGSALVLAAIGLYGLLTRRVAERRRELAVRLAIGAQPRQVIGHVSLHAARLLLIGVLVGIPLARAGTMLLRSQLFGVEPSAPHVFAITVGVLLSVAAIASIAPAINAARVDPMDALRVD